MRFFVSLIYNILLKIFDENTIKKVGLLNEYSWGIQNLVTRKFMRGGLNTFNNYSLDYLRIPTYKQ